MGGKQWKVILVCLALSGAVWAKGEKSGAESAGKKELLHLKLSHSSGVLETDPIHKAALDFKRLIEAEEPDRFQIDIFPGGQLGGEDKNVEDVQAGIIDLAIIAVGNIVNFAPSLGVYDFPYIFSSREEAWKVVDGLWDSLNENQAKESGTLTLVWLEQGFRNLTNSKKPVRVLDDLKGLRIRIPSNRYVLATFRAWGADAVPIAWDEVFTALQQGVVDGHDNPYVSLRIHKFWEIQKYVTELHYRLWLGNLIVNKKWFDTKLTPDEQKLFVRVGHKVTDLSRQLIVSEEAKAKQELIDHGMQVDPAPLDEAVWQQKAMSVWPQFYDEFPDLSLLDRAMDIVGRKRP